MYIEKLLGTTFERETRDFGLKRFQDTKVVPRDYFILYNTYLTFDPNMTTLNSRFIFIRFDVHQM